jgi:hypothetical protein
MLRDLFGCECGRYIAPNKCVMYLDAKWKLKWSNSEVKVGLVNVNVNVREGLSSKLTKIFKGK